MSSQAHCVIKILDAHVLTSSTPLVALLYATSASNAPVPRYIDQFRFEGEVQHGGVMEINITPQEQALLRRLLYLNSTRLSAYYNPELKDHERRFKKSFLLPLGPLSQNHIGRLTNDLGCLVCSNPSTRRCTSCLSARYCGKGSQSC